MDKETIEKVVASYFGAIQAMDMDAWLANFAEDVVSHTPVGGPPVHGHDGMRLFLKQIIMAMESVTTRVEGVFTGGDDAAVKWSVEGTGRNGREIRFEGITVMELNGQGKIRRILAYWDPAAVFAALNTPAD